MTKHMALKGETPKVIAIIAANPETPIGDVRKEIEAEAGFVLDSTSIRRIADRNNLKVAAKMVKPQYEYKDQCFRVIYDNDLEIAHRLWFKTSYREQWGILR